MDMAYNPLKFHRIAVLKKSGLNLSFFLPLFFFIL